MGRTKNFLALDLGAESGRVMLGQLNGKKLAVSEAHRFSNTPVLLPDGLHTDVLHIWSELKTGMSMAASKTNHEITSVGVDTWGVDFALVDTTGALLSNPYQYRDTLTEGILKKAFKRVRHADIFRATGIQCMNINTLFQLYALKLRKSPLLKAADKLLLMPDLFNYWLSGKQASEFCIATTSQCCDPKSRDWNHSLIERFGLSSKMFCPIIDPGTRLGSIVPKVAEEIGVKGLVSVIAPGCHDTALAVAAVPAEGRDFAYLSCGTWSLLGAEVSTPCITAQSLADGCTNEGGVADTFRFQKNNTGLWIVQECRRAWLLEGDDISYPQMIAEAAKAAPLRSIIDTTREEFAGPGNMPKKILDYCKRTNQHVPATKGALVRCVLESLALTYRATLDVLEKNLGRRLAPIHIVGGGAKNNLLCRFTANATGRRVVAGPVEATAIGNILMQAIATGHIQSLAQARAIVQRCFSVKNYRPSEAGQWDEAYDVLLKIKTNAR